MTTKAKAINDFFNGVMRSYPQSAVPDDAKTPYLTYAWNEGSFGDENQAITVNIYARTDSEAEINAMARKLSVVSGCTIRRPEHQEAVHQRVRRVSDY